MALETGTYISDLVVTNPTGSDPLAQADDHLRLLKSTLKNTFPNITGAVSATHTQLQGYVPTGGVIMWSGAVAAIPTGWFLCDGTNGTPDLRDKFVIGARQDDAGVAKTNVTGALTSSGGSKDAIVPSHTHTASFSGSPMAAHTHGVTDPGHSHTTETFRTSAGSTAFGDIGGNMGLGSGTNSATTGISINAASAGTPAGSVTVNSAGVSATNANLPPYYALCFIMKS